MRNLLFTILLSFIAMHLSAQSIWLSKGDAHTNQAVRLSYTMGNYSYLKISIQAYESNRYVIIEDMNIYRSGASNIQFNRPGNYFIGAYDANGNLLARQSVQVSGRANGSRERVTVRQVQAGGASN